MTREDTLRMFNEYLQGKVNREFVCKWALDIIFSKEWDKLYKKDKLLSDSVQVLAELHHDEDDEQFNPTIEELNYYKRCLEGKEKFG